MSDPVGIRSARKAALAATIAGTALGLAFVLGPRAEVEDEVPPVTVPADVDRYLAATEGRVADLVPGVEKKVVWAGTPGETTPLSVVYIHGYSATHRETAPLSERVAEALGANLFLTRLTGHGRGPEAMGEIAAEDLLADAAEAMAVGRRLGRRIVLIGTSTGGSLATWMAAQPEWEGRLDALVLVSPNFGPRDARAPILTWPWGGVVARLVLGPTYSFETASREHARYWTERYPTRALLPMMAVAELAREQDHRSIRIPVITFYSSEDRIVDPEWIVRVHRAFGSTRKEIVEVEGSESPSRHVLAGEILSPSTTDDLVERIVGFVGGDAAGRRGPGAERPAGPPAVALRSGRGG